MMKNKHLARAVQEQKLAEFYRIMQYKCDWHGIRLITADRFYASSKLCLQPLCGTHCGHKKPDLKLSDRTYYCDYCGTVIDRDQNASLNLYHYGKSVTSHLHDNIDMYPYVSGERKPLECYTKRK